MIPFEGVIPTWSAATGRRRSDCIREFIEEYHGDQAVPQLPRTPTETGKSGGARRCKNIFDVTDALRRGRVAFFNGLELTEKEQTIASRS